MIFRSKVAGFSMVEVVVTLSLVAIAVVGILKLGNIFTRQQSQANATFQISLVSRTFVSSLQNSAAWKNTLADTANAVTFGCLNAGTNCAGKGGIGVAAGAFQADDAAGRPILGYRPLVGTSGFTPSGALCASYIAPPAPGNDACPFHLDLYWQPLCAGTCTFAAGMQVQVEGVWQYNPGPTQKISFNNQNYNFHLVMGHGSAAALNPCPPQQGVYMQLCYAVAHVPSAFNHPPGIEYALAAPPLPPPNCNPGGDSCVMLYAPRPDACLWNCNTNGASCTWHPVNGNSFKMCTDTVLPTCIPSWWLNNNVYCSF